MASRTPFTTPATNAAQLREPISLGTEINLLVMGSSSMIISTAQNEGECDARAGKIKTHIDLDVPNSFR